MLGDNSKSQIPGDIFTYGSSAIFTLTEANVISIIDVLVNDETSGITYTYSSTTNKVTITSALVSGNTIEVTYTYYPNYSSTEIQNYIRAAMAHLSICNYYTFEVETNGNIYPDLQDKEANLIAFITATLIEPNNTTYRLPDLTISVPQSLPTEDLIRKAVTIFKHDTHGLFNIV
jgi:hypothetical protein